MEIAEKFYKVLGPDGAPFHGGHGKWHLPVNGTPGKWMPEIKPLKPCVSGYHILRHAQLIAWLGPEIWVVEWRGEMIAESDKCVVSEARLLRRIENWNERIARLFAADCAERVLPIFEKFHPGDDRVRNCIATARRFANGEATRDELDAARDAARAAAGDAAWAAAGNAAWAAAWDAAGDAARDAARDAAWDAAWDAARDAAGDAAWAAARDAAWDAAWDAARDAARAAARAAARRWQTARLFEYLEGSVA